jgi:hypothetical protein
MQELASYVLQFGFNIKNPEKFVQAAPAPPQAAGMPPQGGPMPPEGAGAPPQGLTPEMMAQLQQMQGQPPQ